MLDTESATIGGKPKPARAAKSRPRAHAPKPPPRPNESIANSQATRLSEPPTEADATANVALPAHGAAKPRVALKPATMRSAMYCATGSPVIDCHSRRSIPARYSRCTSSRSKLSPGTPRSPTSNSRP